MLLVDSVLLDDDEARGEGAAGVAAAVVAALYPKLYTAFQRKRSMLSSHKSHVDGFVNTNAFGLVDTADGLPLRLLITKEAEGVKQSSCKVFVSSWVVYTCTGRTLAIANLVDPSTCCPITV